MHFGLRRLVDVEQIGSPWDRSASESRAQEASPLSPRTRRSRGACLWLPAPRCCSRCGKRLDQRPRVSPVSISRAAAPAFPGDPQEPRTLQLPPVPCRPKIGLKYCGATGANSVFTFFQSRSKSSARPTRGWWKRPSPFQTIKRATESLRAICTHALLAWNLWRPASECFVFPERVESDHQTGGSCCLSLQKVTTIQARGDRHVIPSGFRLNLRCELESGADACLCPRTQRYRWPAQRRGGPVRRCRLVLRCWRQHKPRFWECRRCEAWRNR